MVRRNKKVMANYVEYQYKEDMEQLKLELVGGINKLEFSWESFTYSIIKYVKNFL